MRVLIAGLAVVAVVVGCTNQASLDTAPASSAAEADRGSSDAKTAGSSKPPEPIGEPAPAFQRLIGVDDQRHSLTDYREAKAVVIAFICNHCPVAVAYEDRLVELQEDYTDKGVQLIAINVNNLEEDKLPAMKERAEEKGFNFPYLYDPSQYIGREFGATVTPHVFLLDGERKFAYIGPVDDSQDEPKVTEQYLRDAIDAVLAGNMPATTNVKPFGCGIKYE